MMRRLRHHLHDDRLADYYFATHLGELPDPAVAEHLAECRHCEGRFEDLSCLLDGARAEADREIETLFPVDRLRAQQQHIARRLEQIGRPARVLPFPAPELNRRLARRPRIVPRWVAAAAIAGLAVGIGVNVFLGTGAGRARVAATVAQPPRPTAAVRPQALLSEGDDAFLSELEHAADGPQTPELEALDALTPHLVEISSSTELC